MNAFAETLAPWLADFFLLSTLLLTMVLFMVRWIGQPSRRLAVARPTLAALVLLTGLCALPGWSLVHLLTEEAAVADKQKVSALPPAPSIEQPTMGFAPIPSVEIQASPTIAPPALSAPVAKPIAWTTLLVGAYLCGSLLTIAWQASGGVLARRLIRDARPAPPQLQALLTNIGETDKRLPALLISARIQTPAAIGVVRPTILLPQVMLDGHQDSLRPILAHELAHIRHGDLRTLATMRVLMILLWAQPLYWLLRRQIRRDQETLADAAAAEVTSRSDFAEQLVEWARVATAPGAGTPRLASSVGLWESPSQLKQRVAMLLDEKLTVLRSCSRRWWVTCSTLVALVAVGLSLVTLQPASISVAESAKDVAVVGSASVEEGSADGEARAAITAVEWPEFLQGEIRDDEDRPIPNARVRLVLNKIHEFSTGRWDEQLAVVEGNSGESGKFSLDVSRFPELRHRPFCLMLTATAPGYANGRNWHWYSKRANVDGWSPRVKMTASRAIRGRCVDPDGNPVGGAVVRVMADHGKRWLWSSLEADSDGTFEIAGPKDKEVQYWICTNEWSPKWGSVKPPQTELGDIQLEAGSAVEGTVRDRHGRPVAGCVVAMKSAFNGDIDRQIFEAEFAAKTDAQGRYRLPPVAGAYKVYLSQAAEIDSQINETFVVSESTPPLVVPQLLQLEGRHPTTTLDFQAGATSRLGGTIRWKDGRPVEDCWVRVSYMPRGKEFGSGIWIAKTHSNAQGEYSAEVPNPIESITIHVSGKRDEEGVWHYATPAESVEADRKSVQQIAFDGELREDRDDFDWVLGALADEVDSE